MVNSLALDGSGKVVMDLCRLIPNDKYDVSVVSLTQEISLSKLPQWPNHIPVFFFDYFFDSNYSLRRYITLFFIRSITLSRGSEIIRCIEELKPDVLHCHLQPRELILALELKKRINVRLLFTDHLKRLECGKYSSLNLYGLAWTYRKIFSHFHIVAVSKSVQEYHIHFSLINKSMIHRLIENKIDTSYFLPGKKSGDSLRVIYVARLEARKGHKVLLKAWSKLGKPKCPVELQLLGDGDEAFIKELKSLVEPGRDQFPVRFVGSIQNVLPYLQAADIAVFPSFQEGLSISFLEKMSCALPVIASDIPELAQLISNMENGLLFRTGDSEDLCSKLELLINDRELREKLGGKARRFVMDHYDISNLKTEYEEVYKGILALP